MSVSVLGIDLASRSWRDSGSALLRFDAGGEPRFVEARVPAIPWPVERDLTPPALAEVVDAFARGEGVAAVSIDGPQGWRDPGAPAEQGAGRACERAARTSSKTGVEGTCFPSTYLGWARFSIAVFDELLRRRHVSLADGRSPPLSAPDPGSYYVLECFPTATWRTSGLAPLPAKGRRAPLAAAAASLRDRFGLPLASFSGTHDDLQAIVSALPAVGLLGGPAAAIPRGRVGRVIDGVRVEGLIWDAAPAEDGLAPRPTLIVVTGAPGSGKTTLAVALARRLALPLLAKDDVKEALFDALGTGDRDWSRRLGAATYDVLFVVARRLLESGTSCVLESNFVDPAPLRALPPARVVQLFCRAPADVVLERYVARRRHPGHLDEAIVGELRARLDADEWRPLDLGGELIEVDTSENVDVDALVTRLG